MVSPCKNSENIASNANYGKAKRLAATVGVKGGKTLKQKKKPAYFGKTIYLDLKSSRESKKLEACLKTLGATVAVFLDDKVTHVVTDRVCNLNISRASPAASESPLPSPSTSDRPLKPRSRGTAMVEVVSQHSQAARYADPIQLAQQWGIPVLSVAAIWRDASRFLSKRSAAAEPSPRNSSASPEFIKVESVSGTKKPDLLKLSHWPVLDVDSAPGLCPFLWAKPDGLTQQGIKMTRRILKTCVNSEEDSREASYTKSPPPLCNGHVRHSSQDDLKVQCNGLTGARSAKLLSPSGSDVLPLGSSRRSTRRASASWCGSTRELAQLSQLSPTDSELGVTLRPKGTLWLPVALIGTTAEEHGNSVRPRKKKLSPEEKLLQDNKEYFKMEVLNTKLRSSGSHIPQINKIILKKVKGKSRQGWTKTKDLECEDSVDYEALIVENKIMKVNGVTKPKKTRRSELMKLCDEAESFMFGETSRQSDDRDDREDSSLDSSRLLSQSYVEESEDSVVEPPAVRTPSSRLRNQSCYREDSTESHVEAIATRTATLRLRSHCYREDSEDSPSEILPPRTATARLRSRGYREDSYDSPVEVMPTRAATRLRSHVYREDPDSSLDSGYVVVSRLRSHGSLCESEDLKEETPLDPSSVLFSFQTVPDGEPWFQTYRRQDLGVEEHFPILSDPADQPFLLPYELPYTEPLADYYAKRRKRLAHILGQNHPRKSPRCHASTLAILSSLKKRKRKSSGAAGDDVLGIGSDEEVEELALVDPVETKPDPTRRRRKTEDTVVLGRVPESAACVIETSRESRPTVDVTVLVEGFRETCLELPPTNSHYYTPCRGPRKRRKWRKINRTGWEKVKAKKGKVNEPLPPCPPVPSSPRGRPRRPVPESPGSAQKRR